MKKIVSILCLIALCFSITACAKKTVQIDPTAVITYTLSHVHFDDELSEIPENMITKVYQVEEGTTAKLYKSSGATAEEIAVFTAGSADQAKTMMNNVQTHLKEQKEAFASYIPEEVKKLDNAAVLNYGKCVIVVVSGDDNAEKTVKAYVESH